MNLESHRRGVDAADDALIAALRVRLILGRAVVEEKRRAGLPARDPARERAILDRLILEAGLPSALIEAVWTAVFNQTRG